MEIAWNKGKEGGMTMDFLFYAMLALLAMTEVILFTDYLQSRRQKDQQHRDQAVMKTMEWAQYAVREVQFGKREMEVLGEQMMDMRYLLAETCKVLAATQTATVPTTVYNDLYRLADEAVRGYEEEGRRGTPRCVPFPSPFKGGSE
jgi:hypothetical protein